MCYTALTDGSVSEQSIPALLRSEWYPAIRNGLMAAVIVLAVLLVEGTPVWIVLGSALGALVLGTALHQFVLLAGVGVVRVKARWTNAQPSLVQ